MQMLLLMLVMLGTATKFLFEKQVLVAGTKQSKQADKADKADKAGRLTRQSG
jgi:hypothetical protein